MSRLLEGPLAGAGLADLSGAAEDGRPLPRDALERVLAAANPLAAAALADLRRRAGPDREVTHPWTLRVRAPGVPFSMETAALISHPAGDVAGTHTGETLAGHLHGYVENNRVVFSSSQEYEGTRLKYEFEGEVTGDRMSGTVGLAEYGQAEWHARRHSFQTPGGPVRPIKNV